MPKTSSIYSNKVSFTERVWVQVRRQDHAQGEAYWEDFLVPFRPGQTVSDCLEAIWDEPKNQKGRLVNPIVWHAHCLKSRDCGACAMIINGKAGLACRHVLTDSSKTLILEPLESFPVIRDLWVNFTADPKPRMAPYVRTDFDANWELPPLSAAQTQALQELADCTRCGICQEACPQVNEVSKFVGPMHLLEAQAWQEFYGDEDQKSNRLTTLLGEGGIEDCGKVQNCQRVCPQSLPFSEALARMRKDSTRFFLKKTFG